MFNLDKIVIFNGLAGLIVCLPSLLVAEVNTYSKTFTTVGLRQNGMGFPSGLQHIIRRSVKNTGNITR